MTRHRWPKDGTTFPYKTERECLQCGLVKVTRHEGNSHWTEFWRGLDRVPNPDGRVPPCEPVEVVA